MTRDEMAQVARSMMERELRKVLDEVRAGKVDMLVLGAASHDCTASGAQPQVELTVAGAVCPGAARAMAARLKQAQGGIERGADVADTVLDAQVRGKAATRN